MIAEPDRAEVPKAARPEGDVPYFTSDHWTGELEGLWTEADTAIDMDRVCGKDTVDVGIMGDRP